MKRWVIPMIALAIFGVTAVATEGAKNAASPSFTYTFTTMDTEGGRSNAKGTVRLTTLPNAQTLIKVQANGLRAGQRYYVSYATNSTCTMESDSERRIFERFTVRSNGTVNFTRRVSSDISGIGSVGIRTETGQTLVACANTTP